MQKGKLILTAVGMFAIIGGALAFKANRITSRLYYLTTKATTVNGVPTTTTTCSTSTALTTTLTLIGTVPPPAGATGWFTTSLCNTTATFRAIVTEE